MGIEEVRVEDPEDEGRIANDVGIVMTIVEVALDCNTVELDTKLREIVVVDVVSRVVVEVADAGGGRIGKDVGYMVPGMEKVTIALFRIEYALGSPPELAVDVDVVVIMVEVDVDVVVGTSGITRGTLIVVTALWSDAVASVGP